jgi:PAS domain S-box-containing protein
VLLLKDVTKHREAEAQQAWLAAVVTSSTDAVIGRDLDGIIMSWNPAAEALLGYTAQEALGQHITMLVPSERVTEVERAIARLRRGEAIPTVETQQRRKDGTIVDVSLSSNPVRGGDGQLLGSATIVRDITQQKQVEAALRASEERLRLAVGATGLIIFDWDLATDLATVNARYREVFGLAGDEEVLGQAVLTQIVHPADHAAVLARLSEAFEPASGGSFRLEHRALTPAGERWMLAMGQVYFAGEGPDRRPFRVIGNSLDITKRKQAEAALRASEERLQLAVASTGLGMFDWDLLSDRITVNPRFRELLGFDANEELLGQSLMARVLHPADRATAMTGLTEGFSSLTTGNFAFEHRVLAAKGEQWLLLSGQVHFAGEGAQRRAVRVLGGLLDITERKRAEAELRDSEERFRAVAHLVPDLLWSLDGTGHSDWYNQRWLDYTGQTLEVAQAKGWLAAVHPDDRAAARASFRAAAASGQPLYLEQRIRRADGSYRWTLVRSEPVLDAEGRIVRWFGAGTDIHEERVARDELAKRVRSATVELRLVSQRLLTVQEEERRHLARELHDEIGQALTGLQLQLAATRGRADSLEEAEQIVQELTTRVRELSMDLRPSTLDTLGLLPTLLTHMERYQARTGLRIDLRHLGVDRRFSPEVEITAYRVVQEALTNIVRHARASSATVQLLADERTLSLAIRDDGQGFELSTSSSVGGLGGMQERVELLGGTLTVEAAPGGGALVMAELPLN